MFSYSKAKMVFLFSINNVIIRNTTKQSNFFSLLVDFFDNKSFELPFFLRKILTIL